ncbi:hypothetical protein [Microbacterium halophytorum]|uniref:hypothetical protein n=1 Tax=Microbacterium halophytorum TaxID=2067568 RepID=UPI00131A2C49|nr:hypothetical protein [Microbacterium halophytorum]
MEAQRGAEELFEHADGCIGWTVVRAGEGEEREEIASTPLARVTDFAQLKQIF